MKKCLYNSDPARSKGLALPELMIAMTIGLILVGAATSVMISNSQSFRATLSASKAQDSARLGFELMARNIRQAGSIPCGSGVPVDNLLSNKTDWYKNWYGSHSKGQLIGYTANPTDEDDKIAGLTNRVPGTEGLTVLYATNEGSNVSCMPADNGEQAYIIKTAKNHLTSGDIAFICNQNFASIFKVDVSKNDDKSVKIMASENLEDNTHTRPGIFQKNSVIGKLRSRAWYIGTNDQEKKSLYIAELVGSEVQLMEIASGVNNLSFEYHLQGTTEFKKTQDMLDSEWPMVRTVKITLELEVQDSSSNTEGLKRSFSSIVALRNRIE